MEPKTEGDLHIPVNTREDVLRQWTLEAIADVDAGRVIDHKIVLAWARSLSGTKPLPVPGL